MVILCIMALFFPNNSSKDDVQNVIEYIGSQTQDTLVEDALACDEAPHDTETFEYFFPWEIDPTPNNGLEATPGLFVPTYAEGNNPHFDCNGMLEISNSKAINADNVQGIGCPLPSIDISWNASDSDPDVIRESLSSTFEGLDDSQVANWPLMSIDDNETNLTFDIDAYLEGWWEEPSANGDSSTFVVNAGPESSDPKPKGTNDSQATSNTLGNNPECATPADALPKDDNAWIGSNCNTNKLANPPQHRESSTSSVASSSDAKTGDLPQVSLAALPQVDRAIEEDVTSPARLSEDVKPQDVFVTDAGHIKELVSSEFDQHDATNNTVETQRAEEERSSFRDSLGPEVSTVSSPASELAREDITKDPNSGIMQPINILSSDGDVERPQRHPRVRVIDLTKDDDGMPLPIQECCPPSTGSKHDIANTLSSNCSPVSKRGKKRQSPPGFEEWGSSEFQEKVTEGFRSAFLDVNSLWWGMEVALMRKIREYDDHHYQVMSVFLAFRATWSNMFGKYKGKTLTLNDILELRSCWNDTIEILKKEMPLDNVDSSEDVGAFNQALTILTDQAALRDCLVSYADGQQEDDDPDFIAHPHKIRRSSKSKRPRTKSRRIRWNGIAV